MFATASRGHDAEWHLQQEKVTNDRMVATARRHGRRVIAKNVSEIAKVPPPDPGTAAAAVRVAGEIAARAGLDAAALAEVLDALGLTPPPAPVEPWTPGIVVPARPSGTCTACRRTVYLCKDGTVIKHSRNPSLPAGASPCNGSRTLPAKETHR